MADIHDIVKHIQYARSDLLNVLREPFAMSQLVLPNPEDLHESDPPSSPGTDCGYEVRPLLFDTPSNGMVIQSSRSRLCDARPSSIGELSELQLQALDFLQSAGAEVAHRIPLRRGDMIFFNNMRMMHARDAFVDGDPSENTTARYLLRLILKDERNPAWEVPDALKERWKEMYDHGEDEEVIPVHPRLFSLKATH